MNCLCHPENLEEEWDKMGNLEDFVLIKSPGERRVMAELQGAILHQGDMLTYKNGNFHSDAKGGTLVSQKS